MKKTLLSLLIVGVMASFVSCGNNKKEAATETDATEVKKECCEAEKSCCKEMTEEQKADMAAWNDWDNQTAEKKDELLGKFKACIDKKASECGTKEECAEKKEACPEKEAACAAFKAQLANWDNLTVDEKKVLIDSMPKCDKEKACCKEGKKEDACCESKKAE